MSVLESIEYNQQIVDTNVSLNTGITFIASLRLSSWSRSSLNIISNHSFASTSLSPIDFISSMKAFTFLTKLHSTSLSFIVSRTFSGAHLYPHQSQNNHTDGSYPIRIHPLQHASQHSLPIRWLFHTMYVFLFPDLGNSTLPISSDSSRNSFQNFHSNIRPWPYYLDIKAMDL